MSIHEGACPDKNWLIAYLRGDCSSSEVETFKKHLHTCDQCRNVIAMYEEIKTEQQNVELMEVPDEVLQRAKDLMSERFGVNYLQVVVTITKEIFQGLKTTGEIIRGPRPGPVAANLRDQDEQLHTVLLIKKELDDVLLKIKLSRAEGQYSSLHADVTRKASLSKNDTIRVTLIQGEDELESHVLDVGDIIFDELKPGQYTLELSVPDKVIGAVLLEITEHET